MLLRISRPAGLCVDLLNSACKEPAPVRYGGGALRFHRLLSGPLSEVATHPPSSSALYTRRVEGRLAARVSARRPIHIATGKVYDIGEDAQNGARSAPPHLVVWLHCTAARKGSFTCLSASQLGGRLLWLLYVRSVGAMTCGPRRGACGNGC